MPRRRWTPEHDQLVRTPPAQEAARQTGRTVAAVHQRRWQLRTDTLKRPWTEAEDRLLAKLPPEQAARYLKRSADAIDYRRRVLGLVEE